MPSQQQGAYYTQPFYAPQPHVIHHTTVVQPNGMPATMYAPQIPQPRHNGGVAMGMMAGTTMAMSAGEHTWLVAYFLLPGLISNGRVLRITSFYHLICPVYWHYEVKFNQPSAALFWMPIFHLRMEDIECVLWFTGTLLTTHSPAGVQPHQVTYRPPGTPTYSYVPQQWWMNSRVSPLHYRRTPVVNKH